MTTRSTVIHMLHLHRAAPGSQLGLRVQVLEHVNSNRNMQHPAAHREARMLVTRDPEEAHTRRIRRLSTHNNRLQAHLPTLPLEVPRWSSLKI